MENADFIAILSYKATNQGGRKTYAKSGIWLLIKFPFENGLFGGLQFFYDVDIVQPGGEVKADIKLFISDYFEGKLDEGLEFEFYEVPKLTGTGKIIKITNKKLIKNKI
ncbi:MAG: hypothetical protein V4581_05630 [Bacteroidota bacterium]